MNDNNRVRVLFSLLFSANYKNKKKKKKFVPGTNPPHNFSSSTPFLEEENDGSPLDIGNESNG